MLPVPKELGHCAGWRRCPDVCLGVFCCCPLACPLQRRSPAQPPRRTAVAGFQSRERVPDVPLFEPFSGLLSTPVCVSFLFSELIELGTGLSGALPLPARGCASQEAKAAKSGPPGPRGPPNPFGDPRASSYPQPSLRQGHSWAGSGQSARLGTSVLARVALKARGGRGGGGGAQNQPLNPESMPAFSTTGGGSRGHWTRRVFSFPLGKASESCGASRDFSLAFTSPAAYSDATSSLTPGGQQGTPALREVPGSPRGRRRPGFRGPAGCGTDPACSERALGWARRQRPGRRAAGGFKTTQLK